MSDAAAIPIADVLRAARAASGYTREAAVRHLMTMPDDVAVPALAERTADWVPEVRILAREALTARFERDAETVLIAGPAAMALSARARGDWLVDRVTASVPQLDDAGLRRALASVDTSFRRFVVSIVVDTGRLEGDDLVFLAERDPDSRVREGAASGVFDRLPSAHDARWLLRSRAGGLRSRAVTALAEVGELDAARAALLDRTNVVRNSARVALRRAGESPAPCYRVALQGRVALPEAITGVGETGSPDDAPLVRRFLTHPTPRVRSAALRCLVALGAADAGTLSAFLTDPSPSVVSCSARLLRPRARELETRDLHALLDASRPDPTRRAALRLLVARDHVTRLLTDLAVTGDPLLGDRARDDLRTFVEVDLPRSYLHLEPKEVARASELLALGTHGLAARRESDLRSAIGLPPVAPPEPMPRIGGVFRRFGRSPNRR
ncbi:hypothetical protein ACFVU2_16020 [Leifsonia sp. NPDC058194]|uniref:hypothetical protein n=1 Tax=Leifsonia sp. NPDC058194 TaxID=3346374 RepID=UPI0036D88126